MCLPIFLSAFFTCSFYKYFYKQLSSTISRVMYQMIIYLVLLLPAGSSNLPKARRAAVSLLFGLASDGVYICRFCYQPRGSPLHCLSTLTSICWRFISVALALESPPPDVIRHPALRSPDFPLLRPFGNSSSDYLPYSQLSKLSYFKN